MKIPGESKGSRSTRETTQANVQDLLLFYTRIKKCNKERGRVGHTCQKVKFNKMQAKRGKKKTVEKRKKEHVKLYSYSSQALIRWQILFWMMAILPKRERKPEGGRWRRGSCTLLYGGHRGKLQSSVTHLEYLTHCETLFFSNIKSFSEFWLPWPFWQKPLGTLHQFWEWNRSEGCALLRAMTMKAKLRVVLWRQKVRSVGRLCASAGKRSRGDHNSKSDLKYELVCSVCVWICTGSTCTLGLNSIPKSCYLKAITLLNGQKSPNIKRQF